MPWPAFLNRDDFNISLFFTEETSIAAPVFRLMTLVDIPHPLAYSLAQGNEEETDMDFDLSKDQLDIKKAAREFAEGEFPEIAEMCDREEKYPKELVRKAAELGFVGISLPEEYGGSGYGYLEKCLVNEELWRVDPGLGSAVTAATFGADMILLYGSNEQKRKYIPPLVKGDAVMGSAITEPNAGSDVSSIASAAVKAGNEFVCQVADLKNPKKGSEGDLKNCLDDASRAINIGD